ncbi:peptidoglycan-binding protein [Streptomyces sp. NPDC059373]
MATEMTERCATCNAPAEVDGRPGCGCATRAAQREDAVAEAADFHPLRVRPYVAVSGSGGEPGGAVPEPYVVEPAEAADAAAAPPEPPEGSEPYDADPEPYGDPEAYDDEPGRRRGPVVVAAAAVAATAVVVGAVVLATQLLAGSDSSERVLPDSDTSAPQLVLPSAGASVSRAPSASASRSASASASASASRSAASGSTGVSASRSPSRSASSSPSPRRSASPTSAPVLSMGDHGPEVVELQTRLHKVWLYNGTVDGNYTSAVRDAVSRYQAIYGVKGDPDGVYGAHTRASLESKTTYP